MIEAANYFMTILTKCTTFYAEPFVISAKSALTELKKMYSQCVAVPNISLHLFMSVYVLGQPDSCQSLKLMLSNHIWLFDYSPKDKNSHWEENATSAKCVFKVEFASHWKQMKAPKISRNPWLGRILQSPKFLRPGGNGEWGKCDSHSL